MSHSMTAAGLEVEIIVYDWMVGHRRCRTHLMRPSIPPAYHSPYLHALMRTLIRGPSRPRTARRSCRSVSVITCFPGAVYIISSVLCFFPSFSYLLLFSPTSQNCSFHQAGSYCESAFMSHHSRNDKRTTPTSIQPAHELLRTLCSRCIRPAYLAAQPGRQDGFAQAYMLTPRAGRSVFGHQGLDLRSCFRDFVSSAVAPAVTSMHIEGGEDSSKQDVLAVGSADLHPLRFDTHGTSFRAHCRFAEVSCHCWGC